MKPRPIKFDDAGVSYEAERMDLFIQIAVATKLSPLMANGLAQAASLMQDLTTRGIKMKDLPSHELFANLAPLAGEVAKLSQEDQRFIIRSCLTTVWKNESTGTKDAWAPIWPSGSPDAMFSEFREDLILTLRVVGQVIARNMGGFFFGSP